VLSDAEQYNPPICELNPNRSLLSILHSFMTVSILGSIRYFMKYISINELLLNIKYINYIACILQ